MNEVHMFFGQQYIHVFWQQNFNAVVFGNKSPLIIRFEGGARGVMVIVAGIGHGDTSSNPGLIAFHIALIPLGKVWIQLFSPPPPAMSK